MIVFLGFILQLAIGIFLLVAGWAAATNLGFSETNRVEKLIGISLAGLGFWLLYDLSTLFSYNGIQG